MNSREITDKYDFFKQMSWGDHFCIVYDNNEHLVSFMAGYFKEGLENNEKCIWVLSKPFEKENAKEAIIRNIPGGEEFINNGQMIIMEDTDLYTKNNVFEVDSIFLFWENEEKAALEKGFKGLRISGFGNWAGKRYWSQLTEYERKANQMAGEKKVKAICAYSHHIAGLPEIASIGIHHSKIIRQNDNLLDVMDSQDIDSLLE